MKKFEGYNENKEVIISECIAHNYDDLPMKGLGKSMDNIQINEPVIIPQHAALNHIIWGYTKAEIERRAYELNANINWMKLPLQSVSDEQNFQMWFTKND